MELSPKQQAIELVKKSQNILLITHKNPDGDALGSILALHKSLEILGKNVIAITCGQVAESFKFLPNLASLEKQANVNNDFIISLNTSRVQVEKLGYKQKPDENKMHIVITAKDGRFTQEDVFFEKAKTQFDLIIVLDSPDLERLGDFYDENTEIFYEVPLVNIDHHSSNDYFGKINWVDLAATSTCEILVALLEALGGGNQLFTEDVATLLLTGIITDTGSFQNSTTTPKSLTVAAQLVAFGGRQQEIIINLFKTKSLSTLKLWGRILSKIQNEDRLKFVWTTATKNDLEESAANYTEIGGVIDELIKSIPGIDFVLVISERNSSIHGSLRAVRKNIDVSAIASLFGGGGHSQAAAFEIKDNRGVNEVAPEIISRIRTFQRNRLQI
ncbi:MAG: Uncharacterized protein CEN89_777 [Candidatus Berkelbacteria bacterium Licking1014_7]|uniref:Phosphoesterase RecJ domain-containing protein n=1 Tax=Candidatus Berkelbacteria bacterium Licking1014_7 TaxID=2017147 RepID=A0A554LHW7_9BACT|nr:MAG: Uncharacterized protein CEN89_777 [Candidatus Berkelbacteria bacterium Licking1014_7]